MCKYFINSRICFQWILLHEVLFFGFESLGRTGCQYVCHINYSWLDNRNATSWKNNKINSKPNFRYHRKLFVCLFQWHPKKQASKWHCFLYYSSANSSVVKPVFWHRTEQVENSFKRKASTRVVLVYSVEACTAVCPSQSWEVRSKLALHPHLDNGRGLGRQCCSQRTFLLRGRWYGE